MEFSQPLQNLKDSARWSASYSRVWRKFWLAAMRRVNGEKVPQEDVASIGEVVVGGRLLLWAGCAPLCTVLVGAQSDTMPRVPSWCTPGWRKCERLHHQQYSVFIFRWHISALNKRTLLACVHGNQIRIGVAVATFWLPKKRQILHPFTFKVFLGLPGPLWLDHQCSFFFFFF